MRCICLNAGSHGTGGRRISGSGAMQAKQSFSAQTLQAGMIKIEADGANGVADLCVGHFDQDWHPVPAVGPFGKVFNAAAVGALVNEPVTVHIL